MEIKSVDPIGYQDWHQIIAEKFDGDIFHTAAWAKVLKGTYDFNPIYFVLMNADLPKAIIPLFEVRSLLTGKKGISLPFTDFCNFLAKSEELIPTMLENIFEYGRQKKWKYVEFRSLFFPYDAVPSEIYYTHDIDLSRSTEVIWASLKESNRRNIKKAIKEGVKIKFETSLKALKEFYRLQVMTRKRHGLPPQPFKFFRVIHENIITKNLGVIASAYCANKIIASAIYFNFNNKAIFKFGASDDKYHPLRPNNLIMWEAINWHRECACKLLNLGRTEQNNPGLLSYKRSWGAKEMELIYYRFDFEHNSFVRPSASLPSIIPSAFRYFPAPILTLIGKLLYRHLA